MSEDTNNANKQLKTYRIEYVAIPTQPVIARFIDPASKTILINTAARPDANVDFLLPSDRSPGVRLF